MKAFKWLIAAVIVIAALFLFFTFGLKQKLATQNYEKGLIFYDSTNYEQALTYLQKAEKWNKKNDTIKYDIAQCYFQLGELKQSDSICNIILITSPEFAEIYVIKGQILIKKKAYEQSLELFTKAIDIDSTLPTAYHFRGIAWANLGNFDKAIADYEKSQALKTDISTYIESVAARTSMDDYSGAIADYDKILELDADHTEAWYMRGFFKLKIGDLESAIKDFDRAIDLNDTIAKAYFERGLAYTQLQKFNMAYSDFSTSYKLGFKKDGDLYNMAKIDFEKKLYPKAEKQLKQMLAEFKVSKYRQEAYKILSSVGMSTGDINKTIFYLSQGIEEFPEVADFYFYRAVTFEREKKYSDAINDLLKCIDLGKTDNDVYTALGVQYINMSDFQTGCQHLHTALEKGSPHAQQLIDRYCKNYQ